MRERIEKIVILWLFVKGAVRDWWDEVWQKDLDAPYCCDGRECGCGGMTVREVHGPQA